MIRIDVGHHGHLARVLQEGALALVGFDDHDVAPAETPARGRAGERTTDYERGIEAAAAQNMRNHRRRCGLAMRSRYGNATAAEHQRTQQIGRAHV